MSVEDDRREIERMIRATFEAFTDGNVDAMKVMDHPDSTIWDLFEPELFVGTAARAEFRRKDIEQSKKRGKLTITVETPLTDVWGDVALARYYLRFTYQPPHATQGHVRISAVFRRIDGRWLRVHHHEGMVPTGIPPIVD